MGEVERAGILGTERFRVGGREIEEPVREGQSGRGRRDEEGEPRGLCPSSPTGGGGV